MIDLIIGILGFSISAAVIIIILFGLLKLEIWVYNDANRRRMRGGIWAFLVLITLVIPGLLVYLLIRKPAGNFKYHHFKKNRF
ncbi:hypothetical protein [Carnobacterium funditum]|uniref:hypothetical protein n=1 Tax=Carnobacterium funditum TaxID=2752 RepID=UPI00054F6072|nr:hypothetical protein [Carnobacterium funditum]